MKRYSGYERNGVEWLGEIPTHWKMTRIKFLSKGYKSSFIDGDWVELPYITDNGVRLIQTGNIGIGNYKEKGFPSFQILMYQTYCITVISPPTWNSRSE